jgi:hypothetical protein
MNYEHDLPDRVNVSSSSTESDDLSIDPVDVEDNRSQLRSSRVIRCK